MSTVSRARYLPLAGLLLVVGAANAQASELPSTASAETNAALLREPGRPPALNAAQTNPSPASVRPSTRTTPSSGDGADTGMAYPPSPLQTAGAIAGALFAIGLAIAGVTVTFRAMREERRGRGRRRSARSATVSS